MVIYRAGRVVYQLGFGYCYTSSAPPRYCAVPTWGLCVYVRSPSYLSVLRSNPFIMVLSNLYPSLQNKVVFITGGATGIGAVLVEQFVKQGAKVAFVDIAETEALELVQRCTQNHWMAPTFYPCDITNIAALQAVITQVQQDLGEISVLVNNAGSDERHDYSQVTEEYWDTRFNVNLKHMFFAIQACAEHMKTLGGGSIINFGSASWHQRQGGMPGYTSAKAGVEGLTRGMANELGRYRIRVNTVVPGWVMTERQMRMWVDKATQREIENAQCIDDHLQSVDIAAMVLFLASDDSRLCTAQNFVVDGGAI